MFIYKYMYLSLSLYIYIYICVYTHVCIYLRSLTCRCKRINLQQKPGSHVFRRRLHGARQSTDTGVCKINARSENTRYDSHPPFPQISMLTKYKFEWIGVQNKRPIMLNGFGAFLSTLNFGGTGAKLTL